MENTVVTWKQFKERITEHLQENRGPRMCRGQANSLWKLRTTFHRQIGNLTWVQYFQTLPRLADWAEAESGIRFDMENAYDRAAFLARIQHNGFPTPLLDWTHSPYIAAWFAFSGVDDDSPRADRIAVFTFDMVAWRSKWAPVYDYTVTTPHVTVLSPLARGNRRQMNQQGTEYMFTNVDDIEAHVLAHENATTKYLEKFVISVKEKPLAMAELAAMGINAYSLFGGLDGLCRYFKDALFSKRTIGPTTSEIVAKFIEENATPKEHGT